MWKLAFSAAVEKVSNVRVLLGLGQTKVVYFINREYVGQNVPGQFRRESYGQRVSFVVDRETNKMRVRSDWLRKIVKAGNGERARDLARAICAKVEKDHRVAVLNGRYRLVIFARDHDGLDKFIGDATLVRFSDGGQWIPGRLAFAINQHSIRALDALPTLVAIHRVVSPDHRRHLADTHLAAFLL